MAISQIVTNSIANGAVTADDLAPGAGGVPPGTVMLFVQSSSPTGWTKNTSHNDKSLRVVSGTASSGGSAAFSSVFQDQTPTINTSGLSAGATTLATTQIPSHTHSINLVNGVGWGANCSQYNSAGGFTNNPSAATSVATGGGGSHSHGLSGSATSSAITLAVQYVDVIIASKD